MGESPRPKIRLEKRMGKEITCIAGLHTYGDARLESMAKSLKSRLGCGGTVKNGVIEIQGNKIDAIKLWLQKEMGL